MTSAQQKQQNNRDTGGRYKNKEHSEADVALLAPAASNDQDRYDEISDALGHDLLDYTNNNARAALSTRGVNPSAQYSSEDIAQETILAVLERYEKDGGKNIGSVKSWLNRTIKNKVTRVGEGQFHWPNSVAIRQYNEAIAAREQEHGSLSSAEKDKIRQHLLDNWDELNPTMKRHRPQPDFHLYTYRNRAVHLDGMVGPDGDVGTQENVDAFLQDNTQDAGDHRAEIEVHEAIQDLEEIRPKAITDNQITSARYAYGWLGGEDAPEIQPTLDKAAFEEAFESLAIRAPKSTSKRAASAVDAWEQGEDIDEETGKVKPEIAALMAPFGGEDSLSMDRQQEVINTLTRNGRDANHVNRMWTIAALAARKGDQHTAIASQKKKTTAA